MSDSLMSVDDLVIYLKIPKQTIYQWNYRGTGPTYFKVGKQARYRREDVDNWLETQRVPQGV